ncbi:winged helix domain-containing protein [Maricaulis sp.]|uniref:winged helix domain-containing protein n=1 Tax=Maricaulis sp. TaxID=1486257 RepID=UPI003A91808D
MTKWLYEARFPDAPQRPEIIVKGRAAWALKLLVQRGKRGCSPVSEPTGPRWSSYIYTLRRAGFPIETIHESHRGDFPGRHARYVLTESVTLQRMEASANDPQA